MADNEGRDVATGRFLPGNPGGPGRKPDNRVEQNLTSFRSAWSHDDVVHMAEALKRKAFKGDVRACELVLRYLVGNVDKLTEILAAATDASGGGVRVLIERVDPAPMPGWMAEAAPVKPGA